MTQKQGIDSVFYLILVIDILFAPFLFSVPLPLSFLILPIWVFTIKIPPAPNVYIPAMIGGIFAVFSYIYGLENYISASELGLRRLANTAVVLFMFAAYTLSMSTSLRSLDPTFKLLRFYLIFVFILAAIFFVDIATYFTIRELWAFGDSVEVTSELNSLSRFTGTMSDPNNLAISICAITAILVFYQPLKVWPNLAAMALTGIIVIATMSVTGVICCSLLIAAYIAASKISSIGRLGLIIATAVVGIAIFMAVRDTDVFRVATERVVDSDADSRFTRWQTAMDMSKFVSSILIGDGGTIFMRNFEYKPHNGHIHLIYSFGLVCYIAFMSVFFRIRDLRDWRHYFFLIILLAGFTVNVLIYEHRSAGVWVILLVIYHREALNSKSIRSDKRASEFVRELQIRKREVLRRKGNPVNF